MKAGARALGVAESYRQPSASATCEPTSTLAGNVVRADRVTDDFVFGSCTVGGSDATVAVCELVARLDREDVHYLFVAGIAPAWFNVLDLRRIAAETGLPVLSVSFEESPGLEPAIRDAFDDADDVADRLNTYRAQPDRRRLTVNDETVFVRSVGLYYEEADESVRAFTPEGGRPEPLRVARLAARAADSFVRDTGQ
jgi:endonuclease V-like protein UPF0215 family